MSHTTSSSSSSSSASARGGFGSSLTTSTSGSRASEDELKNSKWEGTLEDQQISEMVSSALQTAVKALRTSQPEMDETIEKQKAEPEGDGDVASFAPPGSEAFQDCESATTFTNTYTSPRMPIMSPTEEEDFNNSSVQEEDMETPRETGGKDTLTTATSPAEQTTPAGVATPPSPKGMTEDDVKGLLHGLLADSKKRRGGSQSASSNNSEEKEEPFTQHVVVATPDAKKTDASVEVEVEEDADASLVAPTVSTMTATEQHEVSVATSGRKRRADSAQWVAMRQEELAGLRAELEQRMASDPTPRRHSASSSPSRVDATTISEEQEPSVIVVPPPEEVSVDAHADHTEPHISVDDAASSVDERDEDGAASEPDILSAFEPKVIPTIKPASITSSPVAPLRSSRDGTSPLQPPPPPPPPATTSSSALTQNDTFRPNWSNISNISPDKNDIHSIIVALYGTPPPLTSNMRPSPVRVAEAESDVDAGGSTTFESAHSPSRLNYSGSRDAHALSTNNTSLRTAGFTSNNAQQDRKMWKQQKLREEMKAKEFAECTFHPTISPGTRAMVEIQQHSKMEEMRNNNNNNNTFSVDAADNTATNSKARQSSMSFMNEKVSPETLVKIERRDLLNNVYDRLYPAKLTEATRQRERVEQEMEYKKECRREMRDLREKCGALFRAETTETAFKVFLSNILMYDCRSTTQEAMTEEGVYVDTTYRSPMAVAMLQEVASKKRLAAQRRSEADAFCQEDVANTSASRGAAPGGDETHNSKKSADTSKRDFHVTLFDDFLLRQNAFHKKRQQNLKNLTESLTPDFTPSVSDQSTSIVKELVERSTQNATIDERKAKLMKKHIPVSDSIVKKRSSTYGNECSFHPEISQHAKEKYEPHSPASGTSTNNNNVNNSYMGGRGVDRHTGLYEDYKRVKNCRAAAQKKKEDSELEGYTFKPTNLNVKKNAGVQSMLAEKNYDAYNKYLQRRKTQRMVQAKTEAEVVENEEVHLCTFRPKTSKTPNYVTKMANDFGVLRNQDFEF